MVHVVPVVIVQWFGLEARDRAVKIEAVRHLESVGVIVGALLGLVDREVATHEDVFFVDGEVVEKSAHAEHHLLHVVLVLGDLLAGWVVVQVLGNDDLKALRHPLVNHFVEDFLQGGGFAQAVHAVGVVVDLFRDHGVLGKEIILLESLVVGAVVVGDGQDRRNRHGLPVNTLVHADRLCKPFSVKEVFVGRSVVGRWVFGRHGGFAPG